MSVNKIAFGAGAFAMLASMTVTTAANAAAADTLMIVPQVVEAGHWVEVTAHCAGGAAGPVTSDGLVAPIPLSTGWVGQGQVVRRPGQYTASVPCADGSVGRVRFTVASAPPGTPRPAPGEFLKIVPGEVAPGQRVDVTAHCDSGAIGPVMSDGFVAPVQLNTGWQAQAQAVDRPGRYRVSQTCGDGATVSTELVVTCPTPPTTTTAPPTTTTTGPTSTPGSSTSSTSPAGTTTTSPKGLGATPAEPARACLTAPPSAPKPQVPVKPQGAPETGGGGMAEAVSQWR